MILGGGAAGVFAAVVCAEKAPGRRVVVLEKGPRFLAKVLISGGGRCNVTNALEDPRDLVRHYPRGGKALLGPFHRFRTRDTRAWFESHGVPLKTEADGRVFPVSNRSESVANALLEEARRRKVDLRSQVRVEELKTNPDGFFQATLSEGSPLAAPRLLLATGSAPAGYRWAQRWGHTVEPPLPSLFTFTIPDPRLKGLAGLSVPRARVGIPKADLETQGPLLITHGGLSGPAVLKLSAWGARFLHETNYKADLCLNWGGLSPQDTLDQIRSLKTMEPRKTWSNRGALDLPQRLWERLGEAAGLPPQKRWADLSRLELEKMAGEVSSGLFRLAGKSTFKEEFVTCGGVRLDEVDFRTMESRKQPGLFFAGEILDVDAETGGFNLQNAWTTGWVAGAALSAPFPPPQ